MSCGRNPIDEKDSCGRSAYDLLVFKDLDKTRADNDDLLTVIPGDVVGVVIYRADTTRKTADIDTMDCSYHY